MGKFKGQKTIKTKGESFKTKGTTIKTQGTQIVDSKAAQILPLPPTTTNSSGIKKILNYLSKGTNSGDSKPEEEGTTQSFLNSEYNH